MNLNYIINLFSGMHASFWNVYIEISFLLFFEIEDSKYTKQDRKLGNLFVLGSTCLVLQDHM